RRHPYREPRRHSPQAGTDATHALRVPHGARGGRAAPDGCGWRGDHGAGCPDRARGAAAGCALGSDTVNVMDVLPVALLGGLLGLDVVSFPQAMLSRPIVAATAAGALLGDPAGG